MYIPRENEPHSGHFNTKAFEKKLYFSFTFIIAVLVIIFCLLRNNYKKLEDSGKWVEHTWDVLYNSEKVNELYKDVVSQSRGYIITGSEGFNEAFSLDTIQVKKYLLNLERLTADNALQQTRIKKLDSILAERIQFSLRTIILKKEKGYDESRRLIEGGKGAALSAHVNQLINIIQAEEQRLLSVRLEASEQGRRNASYITWLLIFILFLAIVLVLYVVITTLRMRTEIARELRESEAWFSRTLDGIGDGIIATDPDGRINFLNPVAEELTGWGKEEARGKMVEEVFNVIEESSERKIKNPVRDVLRDKLVVKLQANSILLKKNGDPIAIDDSAAPIIDDNDNFIGVVLVFRDVEMERHAAKMLEQKVQERTAEVIKTEKKYRETLENMLEGVQIIDNEWRYVYVNNALAKQSKYKPNELIGHTMMEKYPGIETTPMFETLAKCMNDRKPRLLENEFTFPDGSVGYFELSIQPVPEGVFILSIDISERKKAELELQKMAASLELKVEERTGQLNAVNAELESFSYSVSHDLRAPLRAISGYATILTEDYSANLDEEGKRVIDVIQDNVKHMGQLINDLLAFARMGKNELHKSEIDMNKLVNSVVSEQKANKAVRAEIVVEALDSVFADESMMRQVITNLVSNAIKYSSKKEKPVIEIGCCPKEDYTVFYVRDNGVGFSMEYYDKLFGVFQRLHSAQDFEGTGVGLALVQRIINRHAGRVWAEAKEGAGATFYFSIPGK